MYVSGHGVSGRCRKAGPGDAACLIIIATPILLPTSPLPRPLLIPRPMLSPRGRRLRLRAACLLALPPWFMEGGQRSSERLVGYFLGRMEHLLRSDAPWCPPKRPGNYQPWDLAYHIAMPISCFFFLKRSCRGGGEGLASGKSRLVILEPMSSGPCAGRSLRPGQRLPYLSRHGGAS